MSTSAPIRCLIADDEPLALELLASYVRRMPELNLSGAYTDPLQAREAILRGDADVAFLDIQMPGVTGMELARNARDAGVKVIFVTAYREFAVEGFRVNALDYLLKPASFDEFKEAVQRAVNALGSETPSMPDAAITVRSDYRQVRINVADILYVEGLKDYVKIYTADRQRPVLTQMSLKAVESSLPAADFVRIHRSYIISVSRVKSFDRSNVLIEGTSVPIGDTYRAAFMERMG